MESGRKVLHGRNLDHWSAAFDAFELDWSLGA